MKLIMRKGGYSLQYTWKYPSLVSMPPPKQLVFAISLVAGSYMAHVTCVPLPSCLLLDPSLYPSLALRRLKRDVGITDVAFAEGKFSCKSCFVPTLSLPIVPALQPCLRLLSTIARNRDFEPVSNELLL